MSENSNPTIAEMMQQLEELLAWFESEEITVEESIVKYEAAMELSGQLQEKLTQAKNKIEIINKKFATE